MSSATLTPSRARSITQVLSSATVSGWFSRTPRSRRSRATMPATASSSFSVSRGRQVHGVTLGGVGNRRVTARCGRRPGPVASPFTRFHCRPMVRSWSMTAATTAATSARVTSPRWTSGPSETSSRGRVVGEAAGPDDRPAQVARAQRRVGVPLRLDVGTPDVVGVLGERVVHVDRRDLHEARDPGPLRTGDRLERPLEVDGALALLVTVRAASGREDDGVAAREGLGERVGVLLLDVEDPDLGAARLEVRRGTPRCAPARPACARCGAARPGDDGPPVRGPRRRRCGTCLHRTDGTYAPDRVGTSWTLRVIGSAPAPDGTRGPPGSTSLRGRGRAAGRGE